MKKPITTRLRELFLVLGLEVKRTGKGLLGKIAPIPEYPLTEKGIPFKVHPAQDDKYKWIQNLNIKTIIDVGGYIGEFAQQMHELLPNARIYSFEPLEECFKQLEVKLKEIPNSQAFNLALGETSGESKIYHNEFAPCSSLLEIGTATKEKLPFAQDTIPEIIKVDTLDNIAKNLELEENIFIKIDVQGFEDKVIRGGFNTLSKAKLILIETSFQEIYVGQALFGDLYKILVDQLGFTYLGSENQQKSPTDGYSFQEDSLFIKLSSS